MWVTKVSELIGSSPNSFEEAARIVVERANRTLRGINGIEVLAKTLRINENEIAEYRVRVRLSFEVASRADQHW